MSLVLSDFSAPVESSPRAVPFDPAPDAFFYWNAADDPRDAPGGPLIGQQATGAVAMLATTAGVGEFGDAPGVFGGRPYLRAGDGGLNSLIPGYAYGGVAPFSQSLTYDAYIVNWEDGYTPGYFYALGNDTSDGRYGGRQLRFQDTTITDSWTGAVYANFALTLDTPHLMEWIGTASQTLDLYVDGVFVFTWVSDYIGLGYGRAPCIVQRYRGLARLGVRYMLDRAPTAPERASFAGVAADFGVVFP